MAQRFRDATGEEHATAFRVVKALRPNRTASTGKLHGELYPAKEMTRDAFEDVLGAMARAELLQCADEVFEKEGKRIPYRTVTLTPSGREIKEDTPLHLFHEGTNTPASSERVRRKKKTAASPKKSAKARESSRQAAPHAPALETIAARLALAGG